MSTTQRRTREQRMRDYQRLADERRYGFGYGQLYE